MVPFYAEICKIRKTQGYRAKKAPNLCGMGL
jgi:hypothetical protein